MKKIKPVILFLVLMALIAAAATIVVGRTYSGLNQTAQVQSIKALQAGIVTFYELYKFLPGDFPQASSTLSLCNNCPDGNGSGKIDAGEEHIFWKHLQAAQIVVNQFDGTGILGGKISPYYYDGKTPLTKSYGQNLPEGHYLVLTKGQENQPLLGADIAERIDLKFDDGLPLSGDVRAFGLPECMKSAEHESVVYNSDNKKLCASLYFRLKENN